MIINMVQVDKTLPVPTKATEGAAGYDLRASIKYRDGVGDVSPFHAQSGHMMIHPGDTKVIPLGIKASIDPGFELQIRPRSGLAIKHGVTLVNGVGTIDSDYRGEIMAGLINLGQEPVRIDHGDRVCQMIGKPVPESWIRLVSELTPTERGSGGLGSSGIR